MLFWQLAQWLPSTGILQVCLSQACLLAAPDYSLLPRCPASSHCVKHKWNLTIRYLWLCLCWLQLGPYSLDSPIMELVALTLLSQLYYFPSFSFTVLNTCDTPGHYFGNWLSDHHPLAHSICLPQARLLAAPNHSFLICHTGTVLLPSPLLLIMILPNDQHFLWGSKVYSHGHQFSEMAPLVLILSRYGPYQHWTVVPIIVRDPPQPRFLV